MKIGGEVTIYMLCMMILINVFFNKIFYILPKKEKTIEKNWNKKIYN